MLIVNFLPLGGIFCVPEATLGSDWEEGVVKNEELTFINDQLPGPIARRHTRLTDVCRRLVALVTGLTGFLYTYRRYAADAAIGH